MAAKTQKPLNIGVLISGSGSNLQSLIDHIEEGTLDAEISLMRTESSAPRRRAFPCWS